MNIFFAILAALGTLGCFLTGSGMMEAWHKFGRDSVECDRWALASILTMIGTLLAILGVALT